MHNLSYDIYGHIGSKDCLFGCYNSTANFARPCRYFFCFLIKSDFWIKNAGRVPRDAFFGKIIGLEAPYVMAGAKAVILTVLFDLLVNLVNDSEVFFGHFHGIVTEVSAMFHHGIKNIVHNVL